MAALGWLLNLGMAGTESGPVTIAVDDADIGYSPYNWLVTGSTEARTNNPGAYIKLRFTGTSLKINVDVSDLVAASTTAADYPRILYSLNKGAWTSRLLTSADTQITLATGLADSTHALDIVFAAVGWASEDRWTTPVMSVVVTGFELDNGEDLAAPTLYTDYLLVYGDSHSEGHEVVAAGVSVTNQDASQAWPFVLGRAMECEVGVVGFAGQGYADTVGSNHNLVDLEDAWDFYWSGQSRLNGGLLDPAPDYIAIAEGTNDSGVADATLETAVENTLTAIRAAAPSAPIFVCIPPALTKETPLREAVTDLADANIYVIDHNEDWNVARYENGSHMNARAHAIYAAIAATQMQAAVAVGGGVVASPFRSPVIRARF